MMWEGGDDGHERKLPPLRAPLRDTDGSSPKFSSESNPVRMDEEAAVTLDSLLDCRKLVRAFWGLDFVLDGSKSELPRFCDPPSIRRKASDIGLFGDPPERVRCRLPESCLSSGDWLYSSTSAGTGSPMRLAAISFSRSG